MLEQPRSRRVLLRRIESGGVGGERALEQLAKSAADHRAHGLGRVRRKIELDERLIEGGGEVLDGIHQRPVEVEDHRLRPCARSSCITPRRGRARHCA